MSKPLKEFIEETARNNVANWLRLCVERYKHRRVLDAADGLYLPPAEEYRPGAPAFGPFSVVVEGPGPHTVVTTEQTG